MMIDPNDVRSALVIKLRAIGDVLLSTPVLENLRIALPGARIDFLTEQPSREVIDGNPYVNEVVVFDARVESGFGLIRRVRKRRYDLVVDLFCNPRSALVTRFSDARYRVGYPFGWRKYCYNILVPPRGGEVHNTEFNLDAILRLGFEVRSERVHFPLDDAAERFAQEWFDREVLGNRFTVLLNAGGGWYTKRWGLDRFASLADRIADEYDAVVIIAWGPGEIDNARTLRAHMKRGSVLLPPTSLKQLAAILKRCTLMVTNDSGPMHIAAAVGTPVVGIFGPTNPDLQGPVGTRHVIVRNERLLCLGCNLTECPIGHPCMLELSVDEVFEAVVRFVGQEKLAVERSPH